MARPRAGPSLLLVVVLLPAAAANSQYQCKSENQCKSLLQKARTTVVVHPSEEPLSAGSDADTSSFHDASHSPSAETHRVVGNVSGAHSTGKTPAANHTLHNGSGILEALAGGDVTSYPGAALKMLRSAMREDPSLSASISLDLSAPASYASYCAGQACAKPTCEKADRPLHSVLQRNLRCSEGSFDLESNASTTMQWDSILQADRDGRLCEVCPTKSKGPTKSKSPVTFVLDQTAYTDKPVSVVGCDEEYSGSPQRLTIEEYGHDLVQRGKLEINTFSFDNYKVDGVPYTGGRIVFAVLWPEQCTDEKSCETFLYLHGKKSSICENLKGDEHLINNMVYISEHMFRPFCHDAYQSLRSVMIMPFLDNLTYPADDCHPHTWYSANIDVWHDTLVPLVKEYISNHSQVLSLDRLHLAGVSLGAVGSLVGGLRYPDIFTTVTSFSPCNSADSGFPMNVYGNLQKMRPLWEVDNRRLKRILMYIGERDQYGEDGRCANQWASVLESVDLNHEALADLSVEVRFQVDRLVGSELVEMSHLGAVTAGMAQMVPILWTHEAQTSFAPYLAPAYGCAADLTWLPFAFLFGALLLYCCLDATFASMRATKPAAAVDEVVGVAAASVAGKGDDIRTHASGSLGFSARSIASFPALLNVEANGVALLNTQESDVVKYSELKSFLESKQTASALPQGLRIAIVLPAGHSLACVLLATMHRGTAVPLDPAMTEQELKAACEHLKVQALVCLSDARGEIARTVAEQCKLCLILCEPSENGPCPRLRLAQHTPSNAKPLHPWNANDEERVVLLLRTSGTTSKGKIVPFSFARLARAAQYNADCIGLRRGEVCLSMMPFYHIAGISVNLLPSLFAGATVLVLGKPFDAKHFVEQFERRLGPKGDGAAPTWYFAVPSVHASVVQGVESLGRPLQHQVRLIRSAGAALDPALGRKLVSLFGASVTPCYGMTEACEITCPPQDYKVERDGSVGPPMTCEIKIDNSNDPSTGSGEVCVKGDMLMKGYEWDGAPEEDPNIEAWTEDGYLRTGDVGHLDSDGWLYLTGRSKEMINRGGETLSPYEVEEVLQHLPHLSLCLAFAAPHASLGECIAVACVLEDGVTVKDLPLRTLLEECAARGLRPVMRPEVVVYCPRSALPMTRTKKYIRAGLAGKLGLTAGMLETCKAFRWSAGVLEPVPEADLDGDSGLILQDSMGQLRSATQAEYVMQNVVNALYGICIVNVMLNHWLPHRLNDYPLPDWVDVTLTTFRSDKALMGLIFALGGHSAANWDKDTIGRRIIALIAIYILMGWPNLFESTQSVATFHRWFIYWLVCCVAICHACDAVKVPSFAPVIVAFIAAPFFAQVPDNLGSYLVPFAPFLMDPYHYWSMGHKLYWLGFFCVGYFYGNFVVQTVTAAPSWAKEVLQSVPIRLSALLLAAGLAFTLVSLDIPHDASLAETLQDWPNFFNWAYPLKLLCEWVQLVLLVVAIQQGGPIMQTVGANILGTFVMHMYLDTGIKAFAESYLFQALDFAPVFGGLLQLVVLFAYPVVFALTVGRFAMYLFMCVFTRGRPNKAVM